MSDQEGLSIQITIGDRMFPIRTTKSQAPIVQAAAEHIQERMRHLSQTYKGRDFIDILAMLTIELAGELQEIKHREATDNHRLLDSLHAIVQDIQDMRNSK